MLASGSFNSPVRLWDANTGKQIRILEKDAHTIYSDTLHVWDAETGEFQMKIKTQDDIR